MFNLAVKKYISTRNIDPQSWLVNAITFSRIVILLFALQFRNPFFLLFVIIWAAFSDFLDGFLSRKLNCTSNFGRQFDQVADKVVTVFFFLLLYFNQEIDAWFIILFFIREMIVLPGRSFGLFSKDSNFMGKVKTVLVYFFIIFIYANMNYMFMAQNDFATIINVFQFAIILVSFISLYQSFLFSKKYLITHYTSIMFGSGIYSAFLVRKMPGTITSLLFMGAMYIFKDISLHIKLFIFFIAILAHFSLFKRFAQWAKDHDPSIYTLDEVIALMVFWLLPFHSDMGWMLGFIFFRFFDILKPLGISNLERSTVFTPAMKVLADDLLAILYTIISIYFIEKLFIL
jgi:phosphatidylglycerophosphate synthase